MKRNYSNITYEEFARLKFPFLAKYEDENTLYYIYFDSVIHILPSSALPKRSAVNIRNKVMEFKTRLKYHAFKSSNELNIYIGAPIKDSIGNILFLQNLHIAKTPNELSDMKEGIILGLFKYEKITFLKSRFD